MICFFNSVAWCFSKAKSCTALCQCPGYCDSVILAGLTALETESLFEVDEDGACQLWGFEKQYITPLQNHRMVGVGRDLCGSSTPTLPPK